MASLVEQRFVEEILTSEGARLLKNQGAAFAARLHFHTKRILEHRRTEVSAADGYSGKLAVSHTAYQRFLDLNRKIHNRFIWGHFNSIAARLANDLTPDVAARIRAELENK